MFKKARAIRRVAAVLLCFVVLPALFARTPAGAQSYRPISPAKFPWNSLTQFSVDLNGDTRPEQVALRSYGSSRTIEINLRDSRSRSLSFTAEGSRKGFLIPFDVDHDADLDLIWSTGPDNRFIVCLNDGDANFRVAERNDGYDAEVSQLFNNENLPYPQPLKIQPVDQRLNASPSGELELTVSPGLNAETAPGPVQIPAPNLTPQSDYSSYLRKRGPPELLLQN